MNLSETYAIKGKTAPNRFAALPMESNDAELSGAPSGRTIERYRRLARGGWGLIFIEATAPSESGKARARQIVLDEKTLPDFCGLVYAIRREAPETVVIVQLNHAGRYAMRPVIAYHHAELDDRPGVGPDAHVLSEGELDAIVVEMRGLVGLAARTGAHGVDLKCCHGYLGAELLRPANTRGDKYGGSFENRSRLLRAMLDEAAPLVEDKGFIVGARVSLYEGFAGGLGDDGTKSTKLDADVSSALSLISDCGGAFVCETMGNPYFNPELVRPDRKDARKFEIAALHHSLTARAKAEFPGLAAIGAGYTVYQEDFVRVAEENLAAGRVDFVGLGRQSFADPDTPRKILGGDGKSVNWCRACAKRGCAWLLRNGAEAGCVIFDEYYREIKREKRKEEKKEKR